MGGRSASHPGRSCYLCPSCVSFQPFFCGTGPLCLAACVGRAHKRSTGPCKPPSSCCLGQPCLAFPSLLSPPSPPPAPVQARTQFSDAVCLQSHVFPMDALDSSPWQGPSTLQSADWGPIPKPEPLDVSPPTLLRPYLPGKADGVKDADRTKT